MADFAQRDRTRVHVSSPFLRGSGIEIGAGIYPQRLPDGATARQYDLRSTAEVAALFGARPEHEVASVTRIPLDFPDGADFLIAHNVLEHVADPIGTLAEWHRFVRDGGTVVLSLPDKNACQDTARLEPSFSHLLFDHLLGRGADSFESREHVLSFALAWPPERAADGSGWRGLVQRGRRWWRTRRGDAGHRVDAAAVFANQYDANADVHWHAFTPSLAEKTVLASSWFGGRRPVLSARVDPIATTPRSNGDILLVYRLEARGAAQGFDCSIDGDLRAARQLLATASTRLAAIDAEPARAAATPDAQAPYPSWIERADRPIEIELRPPFLHEAGHCFRKPAVIARVPGDHDGAARQSSCQLLENGVPLGPAHAVHAEIVATGRGRYSHWGQGVYFATSDNSDPNRNGRRYQLVVAP